MNGLNRLQKNIPISNFMKIRPVGAELFHVDRWADRQKDRHEEANCRFRQFCKSTFKRKESENSWVMGKDVKPTAAC